MPKFSRSLALLVTLFVSACSLGGPVDWVEKMTSSDRKSTIKGMLGELTAFEEQIEIMTQIMKKAKVEEGKEPLPTLNQVAALLELDRTPPTEEYNPAYQDDFDKIEDAQKALDRAKAEYMSMKLSDKKIKEPAKLVKARATLKSVYREHAATLLPYLNDKIDHNRVRYAESMITAYNTGEPCRHSELVDGLRRIGNALIAKDRKAFKSSPLYASISAVFVKTIESDIAVPPLSAINAVNTFGTWESKDQMDTLVRQLDRERLDFALGEALIKVITQFATPEHADELRDKLKAPLTRILLTEPTLQPISYIGRSAKGLANLGVSSKEIVDRLMECLWLDDARGRNAAADCRLALNMMDSDLVTEAAHQVFKRQNARIEERAYRLNYAHTGLIEAKSAELLGDLQYRPAVPHLVMALGQTDVNPEPFAADPVKATFFTKGQVQKTISIARALAAIGDAKGVKPLLAILKDEAKLFEYKMAAAQQLAYLGDSSGIKTLIKIFNKKLEQLDVGNRDLKVQYGKTIALLIGAKDRSFKGFKRDVEKSLKETQEWVAQTQEQIKQAQTKKKEAEDKVAEDKKEVKKLRDQKVKVPSEPKREKVDKAIKEKEGKKAYAKAREAAYKAHEEAMKKYLESLTEDQKKLRDLENGIEAGQKAATRLKNLIFEVERGLRIYQTWEKGYQEILTQLAAVKSVGKSSTQWKSKLSDSKLEIRTLAAYVLARVSTDSKIAREAFLDRLIAEKDPLVRDVILFGLSRHAGKESRGRLTAIRSKLEEERKARSSDPTLKGTLYSLDLLIASLR